ncbi:MAG: limonene,2-epoxide hydrolase [Mycobacterium sp.]|jgi:limonene-1,2-epoxide hydrolase|nr:limonene,2-epoxide hydrolase [Mycobacterium sp.]
MTDQISAVTNATQARTVETFLKAMQTQDFDTIDALVADDIVYQNVGLPTIRGGARVRKLLRSMEGRMGFEVKLHRNVAEGGTVLNERTDVIVLGRLRLQFWVCGVFEVRDGQIALWRDYFDFFDFTKAIVRGIVGTVIPSVRATL